MSIEDAKTDMPEGIVDGQIAKTNEQERTEQEEHRKLLSDAVVEIEGYLGYAQSHTDRSITKLNNLAFFLEEVWPDLASRVYSEAIPKATLINIELAIKYLDDPNEQGRSKCISLIEHQVRHAVMGKRRQLLAPSQTFYSAATRFVAEVAVATNDVRASYYYKQLGEQDKAEEIEKTILASGYELNRDYEKWSIYERTHRNEIIDGIIQAYNKLMSAVQETGIENIDVEQVLSEVRREIEHELGTAG